MNELMNFWAQWLRPSAGLPTVQWSLLLAVAAIAGHLLQRHVGLPKVVGYTLVGTLAGLAGFSGAPWPLQGISLFLLELGLAVVLFEAGGRIPLRWFRHNPMVLVQSIAESALTYFAVYWTLAWLGLERQVAGPLALVALAASPSVLTRVVADNRAAGPVTERAIVLSTLSTLYALTLGSARAELMNRSSITFSDTVSPVMVVLGVSIVVAAALALALRTALRFMAPTSENTSIMLLTLVAAATAVAAHMGGSAPLAALLGAMLLKQFNPRPWAWPRQLGNASALLTMLMFVLVSTVAAQADWSGRVAGLVLALIAVRLVAKVVGVALGNVGSGASWRQALLVASAMTPMSSIALLIASQFVVASPQTGPLIAQIALPAILLMEVAGAVIATLAIYRAGESSKPWAPLTTRESAGENHGS
ncbi:cation:proton antiporter [Simplicispira suum]|uniref:Sodium:proton exchanger n=1 Tax=Simplicispira suum TaxID=2109915 RepID=A0A2S0MYH1_9BURK|nr:cation:proton antiporter [Simplicispira suum]AVO40837.1 sodium:proton exchanger [Simplicispira suum]MBW7833833.1 cation:proton antiporter [Simplicispira suum]